MKHKQEKEAIQIKNEVCKLNQRWDSIYEELKLREKSCQASLTLWHSYQEKKGKMKGFVQGMREEIGNLEVCLDQQDLQEKTSFLKVSSINLSLCFNVLLNFQHIFKSF